MIVDGTMTFHALSRCEITNIMSDNATSASANRPPDQRPDAWSATAADYHAFSAHVTLPFAEDAARLVSLGPNSRVIDVAAGTGNFTFAAARRGASVLATDFAPAMLDLLRVEATRNGLHDRVRTAVMDGQQLDVPDGSFDVAASIFGVLFFPDQDRGLRELQRVLVPGGRAVVSTWAAPPRGEMSSILSNAVSKALPNAPAPSGPPPWAALGEASAFRKRMLDCGFSRAHIVELRHVWVFDQLETFTGMISRCAPPAVALFASMNEEQRSTFLSAVRDDFRARQGDGPYAVTHEALIAVATK
jgi:SAM-dependent methyltransferase